MSSDGAKQQILSASSWRLFYTMAPPSILGLLVLAVNYFVDAIFIGRFLGKTALAGVSFAFPLVFLPGTIGAMVGSGAGTYLSIALGANDLRSQRKLWGNVISLLSIGAVGSTLLFTWLTVPLVEMMGARGPLLPIAAQYYRVTALGAGTITFASGLFSLIQGEGRVKEASVLAVSSTIVNLALNALFLGIFHWDVRGAALATVLSLGLWSVLNVLHFTHGRPSFAIDTRYYGLDRDVTKSILAYGFPQFLLRLLNFLQQLVVLRCLATFGSTWDIAFYGALSRLWQLYVLPMSGVGMAFQPIVGMNFGAQHFARVRKAFTLFSSAGGALVTLFWMPAFLFPGATLRFMLPSGTASAQDLFFYRLLLVLIPAYPFFFNAVNLLQTVGNSRAAAVLALGRSFLFFMPAAWILTRSYQLAGVYYAIFLADLVVMSLAVALSMKQLSELGKPAMASAA